MGAHRRRSGPEEARQDDVEREGPPTWQPISALGLVASLIDAQLEVGQDQHQLLLKAGPTCSTTPPSTGCCGSTARRLRTSGSTTSSSPGGRPRPSPLPSDARSSASSPRWSPWATWSRILGLGARLKGETIEVLLAKSDIEIGIEGLLGRREAELWGRIPSSSPAIRPARKPLDRTVRRRHSPTESGLPTAAMVSPPTARERKSEISDVAVGDSGCLYDTNRRNLS